MCILCKYPLGLACYFIPHLRIETIPPQIPFPQPSITSTPTLIQIPFTHRSSSPVFSGPTATSTRSFSQQRHCLAPLPAASSLTRCRPLPRASSFRSLSKQRRRRPLPRASSFRSLSKQRRRRPLPRASSFLLTPIPAQHSSRDRDPPSPAACRPSAPARAPPAACQSRAAQVSGSLHPPAVLLFSFFGFSHILSFQRKRPVRSHFRICLKYGLC